ncbi:MAG: hypothetical protein HFE99_05505 [Ruminiclostridium sp.]|jgi:hypothetical protein|nr:hypothetical protein [Ruminiclostridium sp.]
MIDIWGYGRTLPKLSIETVDGETFKGQVIGVFDADELEESEDSLSLELADGKIVSFYPSEIKSVHEY